MSRLALKAIQAAAGNAGGIPWDISTAVFNGSPINSFNLLSSASADNSPHALFFKSDGLTFYTTGDQLNVVQQFDLTTAWDLSTVSFTQTISVNAQETEPTGLFFKGDGTKMFVLGNAGNDVNEYDLSTAWDISTASYSQNFSVGGQDSRPEDLFFKDDGLKMYVAGDTNNTVFEYNLSTAWDLSTASYANKSLAIGGQQSLIKGLHFKSDGTRMYITGSSGDNIDEYTLSTAWDTSSGSYTATYDYPRVSFSEPQGLFFKPNGTELFALGNGIDSLFSFDLSTAWDLSTLSYTLPTSNCLDLQSRTTNPTGIFFKDDGTELYVVDQGSNNIDQYSLSSAWNIDTASFTQAFGIGGQESAAEGVFFRSDGLRMYVTGSSGDDVNEYSLSTAWDISTASYTRVFSVSTQDSRPHDVTFKTDGTKMYILGDAGNDINEYNLSTAWNISTASYSQNFAIGSQDIVPNGLYFRDDGIKLYVAGSQFNKVYEYDLSTAWDISTISFLQSYNLDSLSFHPEGLYFRDNGKKLYIVDQQLNAILAFNI